MLASDSYYYLNLTENILRTGQISDTYQGSKYLNKLMLAPHGHWEPLNLHAYIGFIIFKILGFFNPQIPLVYAVSYTPLLLTALSLIPFLFICFRLGCRPLPAFVSSVFFLLAPIFLKRSMFGWYDNDPYNILFPVLLLASFIFGLQHLENKGKLIGAGLFNALCLTAYTLFWQGWVFVFVVFATACIMIALTHYGLTRNKRECQSQMLYFGIFLAASFLLTGLLMGYQDVFLLFSEGWQALSNFLTPQLSAWPDLYISVGELHPATFKLLIELLGGPFMFVTALFGLGGMLLLHSFQWWKNKDKATLNNLYAYLLLTVFLLAATYITLGAQRFAMLCVVPFSLSFCFGLQIILNTYKRFFLKGPVKKMSLAFAANTALCLGLFSTAFLPVLALEKSIETLLNPIYNDVWDRTLRTMQSQTPPDSVVNTWWPPGHFIKATARRSVTFDGATINFPQAYWIANVFLSPDEGQAAGLLRMLNNSGNQSAEYLQSLGLPLSTTVNILKDITAKDAQTARGLLLKGLKKEQTVQPLLDLTHAQPPPAYVLVYNELVENNLQLGFIGRWPFEEIERINADPEKLKNMPDAHSPEYIRFLWSLMGGPDKFSGKLNLLHQSDTEMLFQHNIRINKKSKDCSVQSPKYGSGVPRSIFYLQDNQIIEKKFYNASLSYSVLLVQKPVPYTVLLDRHLAQSLLVKLYYFEGKGLKYFKPFSFENDLTNRTRIYVYEVDWQAFLNDR